MRTFFFFFFFFFACQHPIPKSFPGPCSQHWHVVLPRRAGMKEKSLDRFLTPLDFSRRLLACFWLIFFPRIGKSAQESSRSKQEDIKKLLRRRREAPRHVKKCYEVSKRRRSVNNFFLNFKKFLVFPDRSRILKKCYEVNQEVSKEPSSRMIKTSSSARFLFKFVKVGLLLDGQPEFSRIINKN